ncbi:hypothetical protein Tsubulata_018244 [Turnera subulata]|uniref:Reverse transcriptase zinc-binding domain-containing protein n=1 Tax=Turnera subulata TaxID=218843 RepID=A0A9Q0J6L2_9ROSI|nr:hypothetical protein Tsubulata_018244 [Turnera subulata]
MFTWANSLMASIIDRAMAQSEWSVSLPKLFLSTGWRKYSDHWPLVLRQEKVDWGFKPTRFLSCWWSFPNFKEILHDMWALVELQIPGRFRLLKKLSRLKLELGHWNKTSFGYIDNDIVALQADIDHLDLQFEQFDLSMAEKECLAECRSKLFQREKQREALWLQKSRVTWCRLGDRNTRISFWHDHWSSVGCLKDVYPRLFRVSSFQLASLHELLHQLLVRVSFSSEASDCWRWSVDPIGAYTVKSAYSTLRPSSPTSLCPWPWLSVAPPKRLVRWWGMTWVVPGSLEAWLPQWLLLAGSSSCQEVWMLLGYSMLWSLWLARNALVFDSKQLFRDVFFDLVLTLVFWWFKGSHPLFPYSADSVLAWPEPFKGWLGKLIRVQYG